MAIENNMTLITSDKDFQNIKELKLELIAWFLKKMKKRINTVSVTV
jgi:hypothetical protein